MKDTFHDNHRRVRESKGSGVSTNEIVKPTWYLDKYLTYLIKTCAQAKSSSNLNVPQPEQSTQQLLVNMHYDQSLQRWIYIPSETDEANENEPSIIGMGNDLNESTSSTVSLGPSSATSMFNLGSMVPSALPQLASTPRPSSCPPAPEQKKRGADDDDEHFFNKKGSSKKNSNNLLAAAVHAMEKIAKEDPVPIPPFQAPISTGEKILEKFPIFRFVAERLNGVDDETKKRFENELLQLLLKY
ncbi:uncharacterized protein LOC127749782 [Frankliniella occidentalis]|uniref:Uncharacterized protein LOC127749782 n=1 Tax=Frankliniella occidentalis TaxID=133901 RepID=A0A9C6WZQ9_FRAOC|nr:uncharacterized protein LOC127749782 [Frankliniella occidentalis]